MKLHRIFLIFVVDKLLILFRFASSAEELSACLKIQLASTPAATDFRLLFFFRPIWTVC